MPTSSTPIARTPSNRPGSSIRARLPSARTASLAVSHATASPSATRATVRCLSTIASNAHRSPRRESFARGSAAALVSWRHTCPQCAHRYRRTVTTSVVGRHPNGSCANARFTVSRATPCSPHRWHQSSGSTTLHAITARSGSTRCPTASRPSSSRRANVVKSGQAKVASGTSGGPPSGGGLPDGQRENFHPAEASTPTPAPTRRPPRSQLLHPRLGRA